MAIEWNVNSVNEFRLKMEIAQGVRIALNVAKKDLDAILKLKINRNDQLNEAYSKICSMIQILYNNEGIEEETYNALDGIYQESVEGCSEIKEIVSIDSEVNELTSDVFFRLCNSQPFIKLKYFNAYFDESDSMDVDELEEMVSNGQCLVKIDIKDEDIIKYVNDAKDDVEFIKEITELISRFYFVDDILLDIEGDHMAIYGIHDIYALMYDVGFSKSDVYEDMVDDVIRMIAIKELLKKNVKYVSEYRA